MLQWRLFGISFTIQPSFFFMNALWALLMSGPLTGRQQNDRTILVFIAVWIACTFVSVMVHELGHVIVGRIFGQPGNITLTGLGGQAVGGYDELSWWQRSLVIVAGPCAGFALLALVVAFDSTAWNGFMFWLQRTTGSDKFADLECKLYWIKHTPLAESFRDGYFPYVMTVILLTFINLFVNIMNLFPIIPMDGGMLMKEGCVLASRRHGLRIAFGISLVLACVLSVFYLVLTIEKYAMEQKDWILTPYYPFGFPEFSLCVFVSLAYQCWVVSRQLAAMGRHSDYMQDDDWSRPRQAPKGTVEVPPKDPDDFAPPAPGSERPRR